MNRRRRIQPCVYAFVSAKAIVRNPRAITYNKSGVIYIGVTGNIAARAWQHRQGRGGHFAAKYHARHLVLVRFFNTMAEAIAFEKRFKRWRRAWKVEFIEKENPEWRDLYDYLNQLTDED